MKNFAREFVVFLAAAAVGLIVCLSLQAVDEHSKQHNVSVGQLPFQPTLIGGLDDAGNRHILNTDQAGNLLASGSGLAFGVTTQFQPTLVGGLDDGGNRHIFNTDPAGNLIISGGGGGNSFCTLVGGVLQCPSIKTDGGLEAAANVLDDGQGNASFAAAIAMQDGQGSAISWPGNSGVFWTYSDGNNLFIGPKNFLSQFDSNGNFNAATSLNGPGGTISALTVSTLAGIGGLGGSNVEVVNNIQMDGTTLFLDGNNQLNGINNGNGGVQFITGGSANVGIDGSGNISMQQSTSIGFGPGASIGSDSFNNLNISNTLGAINFNGLLILNGLTNNGELANQGDLSADAGWFSDLIADAGFFGVATASVFALPNGAAIYPSGQTMVLDAGIVKIIGENQGIELSAPANFIEFDNTTCFDGTTCNNTIGMSGSTLSVQASQKVVLDTTVILDAGNLGSSQVGNGSTFTFDAATHCTLGVGGDAGACYGPLTGSDGTTHCTVSADDIGTPHGCAAKADAGFVAISCNSADTGVVSARCWKGGQ